MTKIKNKYFLELHLCILWYSVTSILSKLASNYSFLSSQYILCFIGIVFTIGTYAIFWQQIIKHFKPSEAYSNKSVSLLWTMFFSSIIFGEIITLTNVIGAFFIIIGVIMVVNNE